MFGSTASAVLAQLRLQTAQMRRSPELRTLHGSVLVSGTSISSYMVLVPVFATQTLAVTTTELGLYFALAAIVAVPAGLTAGSLCDDPVLRRRVIVFAVSWVSLGLLGVAAAQGFGWLLLAGVMFLSVMDIANGQTLALGRELIATRPSGDQTAMLGSLRAAYSLGYVVGPLVTSGLLLVTGVRVSILVFGLFYLLSMSAAVKLRSSAEGAPRHTGTGTCRVVACARRGPAGVIGLGFTLLLVVPTVRAAYLSILAIEELGAELEEVAPLLAIAPLAEVVLMPLFGAAAGVTGTRPVVLTGCALAVAEMALLACVTALWQVALLQLVGAAVLASVIGVGLPLVQDMTGRFGFGASVFFAARSLGTVVGGMGGGLIAGSWGLRATFGTAAAVACAGTFLVTFATRAPRSTGGRGRGLRHRRGQG